MKKLLSLAMVLTLTVLLPKAMAQSFEAVAPTGQTLSYSLSDGEAYITGRGEVNGPLTIPDSVTYEGVAYPVVGIHASVFWGSGITTLTIGSQVNHIWEYAFTDCQSMTSVTIPPSVTQIGYDAFGGCSALEQVNYGGTLLQWMNIDFAWYGNPLVSGHHLYIDGQEVTNLVIPEGVTMIKPCVFHGMELGRVTIPSTVDSICENAFRDCSGLARVYCSSLADWCRIGFANEFDNPIYYSRNLYVSSAGGAGSRVVNTLTIPEGVTEIKPYAFFRLNQVYNVELPEGLLRIGHRAFWEWEWNVSYNIPSTVTTMGEYAIHGTGPIYYNAVNCNVVRSASETWQGAVSIPYADRVVIGAGVQSIPRYLLPYDDYMSMLKMLGNTPPAVADFAFDNMRSRVVIQVPCGLTATYRAADGWNELTDNTFQEAPPFTLRIVNSGEQGWTSVDREATCTLPAVINAGGHEHWHFVRWSDGVTDSYREVYLNSDTVLTPIFRPDLYDTLDNGLVLLFTPNATGLTLEHVYGTINGPMVLPDSVMYDGAMMPVTRIYTWDFNEQRGMTSITIPKGVTFMKEFYECTGLTRVDFGGTLADWCNIEFENWYSNPTLYAHHLYINGEEVLNPVIPEGVTALRYRTFTGLTSMTTITLPVSLDTVYTEVFDGSDGLVRVNWSGTLADWCNIGFSQNPLEFSHHLYIDGQEVTDVVIPEGVTAVKPGAFRGLNGNRAVVLPEGLQRIGRQAFVDIWPEGGFTIPSTVTYIGEGAIRGDRIYFNATNCTDFENNAFYEGRNIDVGENVQSLPTNFFTDRIDILRMQGNPPAVAQYALERLRSDCQVKVPCGMASAYHEAPYWSAVPNLTETPMYDLILGEAEHGRAYVQAEATCSTPAQLWAESNDHYHFNQWTDGNTNNPRSVALAQDTMFTPEFALNSYTVAVEVYDTTQGWVAVNGQRLGQRTEVSVLAFDTLTIEAHAKAGNRFVRWDDGDFDNWSDSVRRVVAHYDRTYHPQFETHSLCDTLASGYVFCYVYRNGGMELDNVSGDISGDVVIPDSVVYEGVHYPVTSIKNWVFGERHEVTTVTLPSTLRFIGFEAFYNMQGLTRVNFNGTIAQWCAIDFESYWSNPVVNSGARRLYIDGQEVVDVVIPEGVTSVGRNAFREFNYVATITLPSTLDTVGYDAFEGCNNLLRVNYGGTLAQWCGIGFFEDWGSNPLVHCGKLYIGGSRVTNIVIPEGVTVIKPYVFQSLGDISSVTLSEGVQRIGRYAFDMWTNTFTIPSTVTYIGEGAVRANTVYYNAVNCAQVGNNALPDVYTLVIGEGVQSLSAYILTNNTTTLMLQGNPPTAASYAFDRLREDAQVVVKCGLLGLYQQDAVWSTLGDRLRESNTYALKFGHSDNGWVNVNTQATCSDPAEVWAYGNTFYHFTQWSDGNSDNPRYITLTQDTMLTPEFAIDTYTVTPVVCNDWNERGYVTGGGTVEALQTVTIAAHANPGYYFTGWDDGDGQAERTLEATWTRQICAYFEEMQYVDGQLFYRYIEGRGMMVSGHNGDIEGHLVIPDTVTFDGVSYPVIGVAEWALGWQGNMTAVTLPATIDTMAYCAFGDCYNVTAVYYNGTLAQWCGIWFGNDSSHPLRYAHHLYIDGQEVINLVIPEGVTSIGQYAFYGCTEIANVTLPASLDTVGYHAFDECNSLGRTRFMGSIAQWCNIGFGNERSNPIFFSRNFYLGSSKVTDLVIPTGVISVKPYAFYRCNSLASVTFGEDVRTIGDYAFESCEQMTTVNFAPGLTDIGIGAFRYCYRASLFDLPDSLRSIDMWAFWDCSSASVIIPANVTYVASEALHIGGQLYYNAVNCALLSNNAFPYINTITVGEGVQVLPYGLINQNLYTLKMLCEPPVVENFALDRLRSDATIQVQCGLLPLYQQNDEWSEYSNRMQEGNVYTMRFAQSEHGNVDVWEWATCTAPARCYAYGHDGWHFGNWSDGVTDNPRTIVLTQDTLLTPVFYQDIYDTLDNNIVFHYYYNGAGLTLDGASGELSGAVVIPDSVMYWGTMQPVTEIRCYDFNEKRNMTSITLPKGLVYAKEFYECTGLTRVYFGGTLAQWCGIQFENWYSNPTRYAHHLYIGGAEVINPVIPEGVTAIRYDAFVGLSSMRSVTLPVSIDTIDDEAFGGCDNLVRVNYNGTLADWCGIGFREASSNPLANAHNLYIGGSKVTELVIPEGVTEIKQRAFQGIQNIRRVVLPEGLQRLGRYAFVDTWPDDGITIPSTVTYIGEGAIRGDRIYYNATNCINFENSAFYEGSNVVVGENVQVLPTNFFRSNLWTLRMKGLPPVVEDYALDRMPEGSQVQVQCGLLGTYQSTPVWNEANLVESNTYTLRFGYTEHGNANINMEATCTSPARVSAGPYEGYHFIRWADGVADNPRTILLTQDTVLTPVFYADLYDTLADGCVFRYYYNGAGMTLGGVYGYINGAVTIPDSVEYMEGMQAVTAIDGWVFNDQWGMTQISLPGSLTVIGSGAFCTGIPTYFRGTMAQWCALQFNDSGSQPARGNRFYIDNAEVIHLVVPEGVTSIGQWAFYEMNRLASVALPSTLDTVGNGAFEGCNNLRRVDYGGTVAQWCGIGFANGWNTNPLNHAHTLYIDGQQVTHLAIPAGVTAIKPYAFYGLNSLTSVELPEGLLSIGNDVFGECSYWMSYTVPSTVTSIGNWAIRTYAPVYFNATNCTSMAEHALGETSTVVVGANVQSLPTNLFTEGVWTLMMQGLPPVVESGAFNRMPAEAQVKVQCGLLSAYQEAPVWNTANLVESNTYALKFGSMEHGHVDVWNAATCSTPAEIYAANDSYYHFIGWADGVMENPRTVNLTQDTVLTPLFAIDTYTVAVALRDTLQGTVAIYGDSALATFATSDGQAVTVEAQQPLTIEVHPNYGFTFTRWEDWDYENYNDSVRTVMADYSRTYYPQFEPLRMCDSATFPGLTLCYYYNGQGMTLQSITGSINGIFTMPDSVDYEGTMIPVTAIDGWGTFSGQSNLTWITLPRGLRRVGCSAFWGCDNLTRVIWNGTVGQWCNIDFECGDANPLCYARHLFMEGREVVNLVVPEGIRVVKQYAFYNLSALASVTLPSTLDSIGYAAFNDCNGLQRTYFTGTVADWCRIGFADGWNSQPINYSRNLYINGEVVNSLVIPEGVTAIKRYAFAHLGTLHSLQLPEGLLSIGEYAFYDCNWGLNVTIPSTVTRIEHEAIMSNNTLYYNAVNCDFMANNALPYFSKVYVDDAVQSIPTYLITGSINKLIMQGLPPSVTGDVLDRLDSTALVYVPCGLLSTYQSTPVWQDANLVESNTYALKFGQLNHGNANIDVEPTCTSAAQVSAWGDWKWHFTQWADGVTDNPRTVTLTQDTVLTPLFAIDTYYVYGNVWPGTEYGTVLGNDTVPADETVTLTVVPNYGYHFMNWSDGSTDTVRTIVAEGNWWQDAYFERNQYEVTLAAHDSTPYGQVYGTGTYYYLDNVYAYAYADYGYHFVQWSDSVTYNPRYISLTQDTTLTAEFAINRYSVAAQANFGERGVATVSDTLVTHMDSVTATATPNYGYHFIQWSDGVTDNPRTSQVTFNVVYTAQFGFNQYNIALDVDDAIHGSVSGYGNYNYLSSRTINATPAYGYHFTQWSDGVTDNPRTVTLTQDTAFTAFFDRNSYTVASQANFEERGVTEVSNAEVLYLDSVTVTATPNYGYYFMQWSDGVTDNPRTSQVTADVVYTAQFGFNQYQVALDVDDAAHGTVSGSNGYDYLTSVTISAAAEYGYHFTQWSDGVTDNPRTVTLTQDTAFTAQFAKNVYNVTALSANTVMGSAAVSEASVEYLDSVTLTATAEYGYHFTQWNDGETANPRTVQVTANATYTAQFAYNQYTVSLSVDDAAHGTVSGADSYNYLTSVTISAAAEYGYHFTQWSDGVTDNPRTFTLTEDVDLVAQFANNTYTVTLNVNDETLGTVTGAGDYLYLDAAVLTATCTAEHYHFVQWSDGLTEASRTEVVTEDFALTAIFAIDTHLLVTVVRHGSADGVVDEETCGTIVGAGLYPYGSVVTLEAAAADGFHFAEWDDAERTTDRVVTVTQDTTVAAIFTDDVVPSLYMVSVQNGRNVVIWTQHLEVEAYNIYREGNTSGEYELVATVPYTSAPMWIDTASRPTTRSYRYKMTATDIYGYESDFCGVHKTMHLTISQGIGTNWNLVWTEYKGTDYSTYAIYRGTNAGNIEQIDIMPSGGNTTYTDENAPEGVVYYQVGILLSDNPNTKAGGIILSNVATNNNSGGEGIANVDWGNIKIYALDGRIVVEGADGQTAVIYDVTGRKIASHRLMEGGTSEIAVTSGVYLVKIDNLPARRVVVTR